MYFGVPRMVVLGVEIARVNLATPKSASCKSGMLGFAGLHSGYILIGLQGCNPDGTPGTYQPLGTPDQNQWLRVSPQYGNKILTQDGQAHALLMSPVGLKEV